jgi:hypothetical protein
MRHHLTWARPTNSVPLTVPDAPTKDDRPKSSGSTPDAPAEPRALDDARKAMDAPAPDPEPDAPKDEDEEEEDAPEDLASPEAIARRVAALGEEDAVERVAREEEAKLAERRKAQKKGKKKGGLEAAASKRLSKIGSKAPVKRALPIPSEADPIIDRAVRLQEWAKKNQGAVSGVVGAALLGLAGLGIYTYVEKRHEGQASAELEKALKDEHGRVGDPDKDDEDVRTRDPRPVFKTADDRRAAALRDYRDVESKFKGTGAAILAKLAEGSLLLDKSEVSGAMAAFEEVKDSPLAKADAEVRGRALEGLGFAYELKADADKAGEPAALEEASKVFRELENTDVMGFKEAGMYHQARVFEKQGDKSKAIDMLKKLHERVTKPGDNHAFVYLEHVADDRLRALDPSAIPAKAAGQLGGPGQNQLTQAQLRRMMEQAQQKRGQGGGPGGKPGAPPVPEPEDLPP